MPKETRALLASVAVSLALHLVVLLAFPEVRLNAPSAGSSRMLTARLAPRAATPDPVPVSEEPRAAEKRKYEPRRERAETRPKQVARQSAPDTPAPGPLPTHEAPASPPGAASENDGARTPAATASLAAPQVQETPASPGKPRQPALRPAVPADTRTLDQYRLALIGAARHYKRYPARAMENGWQGRVEVRLVIGSNGSTQKASIKTSSGYEILDNEALNMIRKAKPLAPIPASLRGREFTVDIPVIFDLQTG